MLLIMLHTEKFVNAFLDVCYEYKELEVCQLGDSESLRLTNQKEYH